jgi:hypothetical protein
MLVSLRERVERLKRLANVLSNHCMPATRLAYGTGVLLLLLVTVGEGQCCGLPLGPKIGPSARSRLKPPNAGR